MNTFHSTRAVVILIVHNQIETINTGHSECAVVILISVHNQIETINTGHSECAVVILSVHNQIDQSSCFPFFLSFFLSFVHGHQYFYPILLL